MRKSIPSLPARRQWWLVGLSILVGCDAGRREPLPAPIPAPPPAVSAPTSRVADAIEADAAAGARIAGRVEDGARQPLKGAVVLLFRESLDGLPPSSSAAASATTAADGRFAFDALAPGRHEVIVHAPGRGFDLEYGVSPGTLTLDFVLQPEARVAGYVVLDTDGSPVAGAAITLDVSSLARAAGLGEARSGPDGRFELRGLRAGYCLAGAAHDELVLASEAEPFKVGAGKMHELRLVMKRGIEVACQVVDVQTWAPVAGARVELRKQHDVADLPPAPRVATADHQGRLVLKGLTEGEHTAFVAARGHVRRVVETFAVAPGAKDATFPLEAGGTIAGRVLDAAGRPLAGARVEVSATCLPSEDHRLILEPSTTTGDDGRYRLAGLPAWSSYTLLASSPGHAFHWRSDIKVELGGAVEGADIALRRGATIRGRVLDEKGKGIAGAQVNIELIRFCSGDPPETIPHLQDRWVQSGEGGVYVFPDTVPDEYWLEASAPALFRDRTQVFGLKEGETYAVDFHLARPVSLSGRVIDPRGQPVLGAELFTRESSSGDPRPRSSGSVDGEGRFRVEALRPGPLEIWAESQGMYSLRLQVEAPAENLEITLKPAGIIAGRVRAAAEAPLSDLRLRVVRLRQGIEWESETRIIDPTGFFELSLEEGSHVIQAFATDCSPASTPTITVEAGGRRDGIELQLHAEAVIEGQVTPESPGKQLEGTEVVLRPRSFLWPPLKGLMSDEGRFEIRGVPAGEMELVADAWKFLPSTVAGIQLQPGERRAVNVDLRTGGSIIVRASTSEGPLAHADLSLRRGSVEYSGYQNARGELVVSGLEAGFYLLRVEGRTDWQNVQDTHVGWFDARASSRFEYAQNWGMTTLLEQPVSVIEGETATVDVVEGPRTRIHGQATIGGVPAGGLRVQALHAWRTWPTAWSKTNEGGGFELFVAPGETTILVGAGDASAGEAQLQLTVPGESDDARIDLVLPNAAIRGTVVEAGNAIPVEGAVVEAMLHGERFPSYHALRRARKAGGATDHDGRFLLPYLPPGTYLVVAMAEGFAGGRLEEVRVTDADVERGGQTQLDVKVEVRRRRAISLRAVDAGMIAVSGFATVVRDASGNLGTPLAGPCEITVLHPGFAPARIALPDIANAGKQVVVLERGGALAVRVDDASGGPVAGAVIEVRDASGRDVADDLLLEVAIGAEVGPIPPPGTGPGGEVFFGHLPPGAYTVLARLGGVRSAARDVVAVESGLVEARLVMPGR